MLPPIVWVLFSAEVQTQEIGGISQVGPDAAVQMLWQSAETQWSISRPPLIAAAVQG